MASNSQVTPDTLISVKIQLGVENRRFKIPFKDLGAKTLPDKLRTLLSVPQAKTLVLERYSDSAGAYVRLDSSNVSVYKQLARAAKAKLKLRIKVTVVEEDPAQARSSPENELGSGIDAALRATTDIGQAGTKETTEDTTPPSVKDESKLYELNNISGATLQPMQLPKPGSITQEPKEEEPAQKAFPEDDKFFKDLAKLTVKTDTTKLYSKDQSFPVSLNSFTVHCNNCSEYIPGIHWHCSVCEGGDYDLCHNCVEKGEHCEVDSHYLIKRVIKNGQIINSVSEYAPRKDGAEKEVPGAFQKEPKESVPLPPALEVRTCNNCVTVFPEDQLVTCQACDDWDLCLKCLLTRKHGHHPGHEFAKIVATADHSSMVQKLCAPGRGIRHFATCDGCDKTIYGVRHKCATCPDWDFCDICLKSARHIHPTHRFIPIYDAISIPTYSQAYHSSIKCDGPLCVNSKGYIRGDRYKCSVCFDTDFCANCEALPTNLHNRTHPLIKFRTPVQLVAVTTYNGNEDGTTTVMGDRTSQTSSKSTETSPVVPSTNKATQVQTVAEVKPIQVIKDEKPADNITEEEKTEKAPVAFFSTQLEANFVRDLIADGTSLPPNTLEKQVWTIRNPGPLAWPVGCSVRYIGGDRMLNLAGDRPLTLEEIDNAVSSNTIDREVQPSEEVEFEVTIRTPSRVGKAISYWRLKTKDGVPFGHKLWCDVNVKEPEMQLEPEPEHETETITAKAVDDKDEPTIEHVEKDLSESHMIFPKLEKESPAASTHDVTPPVEKATDQSAVSTEAQEITEDLESLELEDSDTEDGFLTDEEYEILDSDVNDEALNGKK